MGAARNRLSTFVLAALLAAGMAVASWLALASYRPARQNRPGPEERSVLSCGENTTVASGYIKKNVGGGAAALGVLKSVRQEGKEVIGRFSFGGDREAVEIDFVIGLIEPKESLHFRRSKSRELCPTSDKTQYQVVEPERIGQVLQPYLNRLFRLGLQEPYDEERLLQKGIKEEIISLIKTLNPYFQCNVRLIQANKAGVVSRPAGCRGAIFDLLVYDTN